MAELARSLIDLPPNFTTEGIPQPLQNRAQQEIQQILSRPENYTGRQFVRGLVIDPENVQEGKNQDRDDAVWVDEDRRIVQVSITDVAAYIKEGSALDQIGQLKGFSQYKGGNAVDPMFPKELSEGKMSLLQGQVRLTMTVNIQLNEAYDIQTVFIQPTWMRSPHDFSYIEAAIARDDPRDAFHNQLVAADRIARRLRNKRFRQGESFEEDSERRGEIVTEVRMHHMIEEFMLLANKALAQFALENGLPIVYRNHKRKKQQQAYYSDMCEGHDDLHFDTYLHGTSPLRRYADLYVWRVIKRFLARGEIREKDAQRAPRVARRVNWIRAMSMSA